MKKIFPILLVSLLFLVGFVFAQNKMFSSDVQDMVKNAVEQKGIDSSKIESVEEVNFDNLPAEINIQNIDDTSLSLYKVEYGGEKPFYIISTSEQKLAETAEKISGKMLLNFGYEFSLSESSFLKSSVGSSTNLEKGYIMLRKGSITGISTNLEIVSLEGSGSIEIIIYKNGEEVGFRNLIVADKVSIKKDYDIISENTLNFEQGDVISAYIKINGKMEVKDINNLIELITF